MKKLLLLSILFAPIVLLGQSTWRNGTVYMKDGTKLEGKINDLEWETSPEQIEFQHQGQSPQVIKATDIISFCTDRPSKYILKDFSYDGDDQGTNRLPSTKEPEALTSTKAFMEVLVDSRISLLKFTDKNSRVHFFIQIDSIITELLKRQYKVSSTTINTYERYKQQLTLITNDCPEIQSKLRNLNYSEDRLQKAIREINQCKSNSIEPLWSGPATARKKTNFGIVVQGFSHYTEFSLITSGMQSPNYAFGLYLESFNKKKPNRISYYNELCYKIIHQSGKNIFGQEVDLNLTRIKLIDGIRFSYPSTNGRFFWTLGIENGFRLKTDIGNKNTTYYDNGSEYEFGLMLDAGKTFIIGKSLALSTAIRYELEQHPFSPSYFIGAHNLGLNVQVQLK